MELIEIKLNSWEQQRFEAFTSGFGAQLSMTANINITNLVESLKKNDIKFSSAFNYMVTKIANNHKQFRMRINDKGNLAYYNQVNPAYTLTHKDIVGGYISSWSGYYSDFEMFNTEFLKDLSTYSNEISFFARELPPNIIYISANPWVSFTNFTYTNQELTLYPQIITGKKFMQGKEIILPVSFHINHMVADGYHLGIFFSELQNLVDDCEEWLMVKETIKNDNRITY